VVNGTSEDVEEGLPKKQPMARKIFVEQSAESVGPRSERVRLLARGQSARSPSNFKLSAFPEKYGVHPSKAMTFLPV
jgi:hypothetical protein